MLKFSGLNKENKAFINLIINNYSDYIDSDTISTDSLKEICDNLIDSGIEEYSMYSFKENEFSGLKFRNHLMNSARNGTGTRGVYHFPYPNESGSNNFRGVIIDSGASVSIPVNNISEEDITKKQLLTFNAIAAITQNIIDGEEQSLIIVGSAGMGKTTIVMEVLENNGYVDGKDYIVRKGSISARVFYERLFQYRQRGELIILDDADPILMDQAGRALIKAACDDKKKRVISWDKKNVQMMNDDGEILEPTFVYEGSIIIISNIDINKILDSENTISADFEAMASRTMLIDIGINTNIERLVRVKSIIKSGMMDKYNLNQYQLSEIIDYIEDNIHRIPNLCLRLVGKITRMYINNNENWKDFLEVSIYR